MVGSLCVCVRERERVENEAKETLPFPLSLVGSLVD